jgi:hypothetical protein
MARIPDVERRLQNWARWKQGLGSGGLGFGGSSWNMEASGSRYREAVIPTVDCEASETDQAVQALDERLRSTVRQVYLTGASTRVDACVLGISPAGVDARVWEAHTRIAFWFTDRQALARQERERLERLRLNKVC